MIAPTPLARSIAEFLRWQELDRHRSLGTIREYRKDLDGFAEFVGATAGVREVAAIDRELLGEYQRHLARLQVRRPGVERPLAPATRHRRLVSLRSFLRFAARRSWLPGDLGTRSTCHSCPNACPSRSTATTATG